MDTEILARVILVSFIAGLLTGGFFGAFLMYRQCDKNEER